MKKTSKEKMTDELRPVYDFRKLQVVARGPKRKAHQEKTINLDPDVVEMFPDSDAVNEALRFLIRAAKSKAHPHKTKA